MQITPTSWVKSTCILGKKNLDIGQSLAPAIEVEELGHFLDHGHKTECHNS